MMTESEALELRKKYPPMKRGPNEWGMVYEDTVWGAIIRRDMHECYERALADAPGQK